MDAYPKLEPATLVARDARVLSVSVDCDALRDYLNFAPAGTSLVDDQTTYPVLISRLLALFQRHRIRATFFCVGEPLLRDAKAAEIMRRAVAAGHEMGNHSFSHPDMDALDECGRRTEVEKGHEAIQSALGVSPIGYRGPGYHMSAASLEAIASLGYRYDSSACPARLFGLALGALKAMRPDYRRKQAGDLQRRFKDDKEVRLQLEGGKSILEWPIPVGYGLAFYGTFHAILPRSVFHAHHRRIASRTHLHYELHPIEVVDAEIAARYPWLPTAHAAMKSGRDLTAWLDERLGRLVQGRRVMTLGELSGPPLPVH